VGPQPILVDVLSFDRRDPASSIWLAYGQYVRTFLFPLLAKKLLHWPMEMTLFRRDGYEPMELYGAMRWPQRMSRAALWPITLPALVDKRKAAENAASAPQTKRDPEIALQIQKRMLAGLRKRTRSAVPKEAASEWAEYLGALTHYTKEEAEQKRDWVKAVLEELRPEHVLDVGANTGEFSALAASCAAEVVALERDAEAAERIVNMSRTKKLAIQTIHADLSRPTPAVGWENRESSALLPRLEGKFEVVMMLAVIHHLLLLEQIPLAAIMALAERLTTRYLIVEWVPATDPMFVSLMRGRDDLYGSLSEGDLMTACEGRFRVVQRQGLSNGRVLFLFERQTGGSTNGAPAR
jgi:SAM-dependent methyltransferase